VITVIRYQSTEFKGGYYNNNVSNIIGSAVANQSMTTIGAGAIGGIQVATPTVVW
jgi:hypothetical protein